LRRCLLQPQQLLPPPRPVRCHTVLGQRSRQRRRRRFQLPLLPPRRRRVRLLHCWRCTHPHRHPLPTTLSSRWSRRRRTTTARLRLASLLVLLVLLVVVVTVAVAALPRTTTACLRWTPLTLTAAA